jgi:AcrR family transcriptional regulator
MDKNGEMSENFGRTTGKEEPLDRRSQRTREALIHALLALIETHHYDQITIQDIVDRANVGRSTFYAHFENKDELLSSGFLHMLDGLIRTMDFNEENRLVFDISTLFKHARGHYEIYRTLIWGSGFELLIRQGPVALSGMIEARLVSLLNDKFSSPVPLPVLAYTMAGTLLLLLKWWLENKMLYSPEQMNDIFQELVMPGMRSALGFSDLLAGGKNK